MRIEAVVACVGFGDYLDSTLPSLLPLVDDVVVYTAADDSETLGVCVRWGVRPIQAEAHKAGGQLFDKAAAINHALQYLRRDGWLLTTDADIVWPANARRLLERAELDQLCLYGMDRLDLLGWTHWAAWVTGQSVGPDHGVLMGLPTGARWGGRFLGLDGCGWLPAGYGQLWHSRVWADYAWAPGCDADGADMLHARRWPRAKRVLIPELVLLHLLAEARQVGRDWHGRTTARWGPPAIRFPPAPAGRVWPGPSPAAGQGPEQSQDLDGRSEPERSGTDVSIERPPA